MRRILPFALGLVLSLGWSAGPASAGGSPAEGSPRAAGSSTINWDTCPVATLSENGFDCAWLPVPLDRRKPTGPKIDLLLVRHPATGPERIGSLVFNPGGPGGSGSASMPGIWANLPAEVKARFDLVTWDPRGVGYSSPLAGCQATPLVLPATGAVNWDRVAARFAAGARKTNAACRQANAGLIRQISTNANVADLEQIRIALGEGDLNYWGMSYGSRIGYVYALQYPGAIRTMVLDGSVDPAATLLSLAEGASAPEQAFGSFTAAYPAAAGHYRELIGHLNQTTFRLPDGQVLDRWLIRRYTFLNIAHQVAYRDLAGFLKIAHQAVLGSGEDQAQAAAAMQVYVPLAQAAVKQGSNNGGAFAATNCHDYPGRPTPASARATIAKQIRLAPENGGALAVQFTLNCSGVPATRDRIARITGSGSPVPLLILGATRDGATPAAWTARMSRAFPESRTVTYAGGQHVTWGMAGSACVDEVANTYVLTGQLPAHDIGCANTAVKEK